MNIEQARFNMIEQQLRPAGVCAQEVLDLFTVVRREHFVPSALANLAFADIEIPLPCGENMLTPLCEARILQAVAVKSHENVLEIGTGSGYMAALLAHRARHVQTVEIEPALKELAEKNLADYGVVNVEVVLGDGAQGWGDAADSYDIIVISGALPALPQSFLKQVKIGGRVAAFIGSAPLMAATLVTRVSGSTYETVTLFDTCVKPLRQAEHSPLFRL
ncbi:MAG: protein-L-isoaspartate O-methyltransferase [Burkholderiaceae bacterium]|nr:protein-L-isoaspartate O-methyltransferase [Burkholderiaceae bacterium]